MGDRLTDMRVFTRVARLESFSQAARELGLSSTAVSRRVGELEDALGVKLLQRTTRRLALTDVGRVYLDRCESLLSEIADLEDQVMEQHGSPKGVLRIASGVSFAQEQLAPILPEFLAQHPELVVELELSDRPVDLIADGIDVAVRIGRLEDSSLVARRLAVSRLAVVASRSYLEARGRPGELEELSEHECIIDLNQPRTWRFRDREGQERTVVPSGRLRMNSAHSVLEAARAGMGIALVPTFVAGPALLSGQVESLLPKLEPEPVTLNAIYPVSRHLSTRVRVFVDYLQERFGDPPSWDAWREGPGSDGRGR